MPLLTKKLELPDSSHSRMEVLNEAIEFITHNLPVFTVADNIMLRAKFIITELLTNASKHAGKTETHLTVEVTDSTIIIDKIDHGNRFNPNDLAGKLNRPRGSKVQLSASDMYLIYAVIENDGKVRFECEENTGFDNPDLTEMIEHFGLLIIIKSADGFTYYYDQLKKQNVFSTRINLF